jgi:hypothetical protein
MAEELSAVTVRTFDAEAEAGAGVVAGAAKTGPEATRQAVRRVA